MGKAGGKSAEQTVESSGEANKDKAESEVKEETPDTSTETTSKTEGANVDRPIEKKEDVENLRKVIKLGSNEGEKVEEEKPTDKTEEDNKSADIANPINSNDSLPDVTLDEGESRNALEQKRAILQSIKDFDFQIKKNQENIGSMNQKLDSLSRDLDDLVSLYEIVSEQMNPFVGISQVTKKRIDGLENMIETTDSLAERVEILETFAQRSGAKLKNLDGARKSTILKTVMDEAPPKADENTLNNTISVVDTIDNKNALEDPPDKDLDRILEISFNTFSLDNKIDMTIDKFIENLKDTDSNVV